MTTYVGNVKLNRLTTKEIAGFADGAGGTDPIDILSNLNAGGAIVAQDIQATSLTSTGALSVAGTSAVQALTATDLDCSTVDTTGDMSVGGNLAVAGSIQFNDMNAVNITASGNLTAGGDLAVSGNSTLDTLTAGVSTFTGAIDAQAGLTSTTLVATGTTTAVDVNMSGAMSCLTAQVNNTLGVSGVSTLGQLDAQATTATSLSVSGSTSLQDTTATSITASGAVVADSLTTTNSVTVGGDLIVNGQTTTINSTEKHIKDAVLALGDDSVLSVKDAGVKLLYNDGSAKIGFMGFDTSDNKFAVFSDAVDTSEVFSGTLGDFKCGNLEADGVQLGGDIECSNLVVNMDTSLQDFTAVNGSLTGTLGVSGAGTFSDTLSVVNGLSGSTASFSTSVDTPLVKTATLSSDNASIVVNKNLDATGFDLNAKEITLTDDLNAVNAVLSGDASAVNMTATTNMTADTGKFDKIDSATGGLIAFQLGFTGTSGTFTSGVTANHLTTINGSVTVATGSKVKSDTLDSNGSASITVEKPLAMGANQITTTGQINSGSLVATGVVKGGTLKAPTLTTDATEISVTKPINLNANKLQTTGQIEGDTGVFTTSVSAPLLAVDNLTTDDLSLNTISNKDNANVQFNAPVDLQAHALTSTSSVSAGTMVASTSVSAPLVSSANAQHNTISAKDNADIKFNAPVDLQAHALTSTSSVSAGTMVASTSVSTPLLTSATTSISVNKDIALGAKNLTTTGGVSCGTATASTKVDAPLLDNSAGTDIKLNKDLNFQAFNITGTGDITTTGKVECGELNILSASTDTILASSTTTDSLVINGSVFTPSDQTINNLKVAEVEAVATNINLGKADGTNTIDIRGTLKNNGNPISTSVADINDITNVDTSTSTLADAVSLRYDPSASKWVAEDNFFIGGSSITLNSGDFWFDGTGQKINGENYNALVDDICETAKQIKDTSTDLIVSNGTTNLLQVDKSAGQVLFNGYTDLYMEYGNLVMENHPNQQLISVGVGAKIEDICESANRIRKTTGDLIVGSANVAEILKVDKTNDKVVVNEIDATTYKVGGASFNPIVSLQEDTSSEGALSGSLLDGTPLQMNPFGALLKTNTARTKVAINKSSAPTASDTCLEVEGGCNIATSAGNGASIQLTDRISLYGGADYAGNTNVVSKLFNKWEADGEFTADKLKVQQTPTALSISSGAVAIDFESLSYKVFTLSAGESITSITPTNLVAGLNAVIYITASTAITLNGSTTGLTGAKVNFNDIALANGEFAVLSLTSDGTNLFVAGSKFA